MTEPAFRTACITVDLDGLDCYRNIHGLEPGDRSRPDAVYTVGLVRLLDFFDEFGIRSTLFVIGRDADRTDHVPILEDAVKRGHELASHSWSHDYGMRHRSLPEQRRELILAEEVLADIIGETPVGFRTPGYNVSSDIIRLCAERGYIYDSSVFPCPPYYAAKAAIMGWLKLRGRPSRSSMTDPKTLLAPITPYRPAAHAFWKRDPSSDMPLEVPMCLVPGMRFPVIGTSLHLMESGGFDLAFPLLKHTYDRLLNLEFHAIDFMDAQDPGTEDLVGSQPDLSIPWNVKRQRYAHVFHRLSEDYRFAPLATAVRQF